MMPRQEGYGCSSSKMGSFTGLTKGMKVNRLHSQHGDSIGDNLSPRSVLEHRVLSGLAIAIDLEEKKNKPSHARDHVVLGRYCCKEKMHCMGADQEAKSQHNLILGSSLSRERLTLTHLIHKERETMSDVPIVGLRVVASLYPMSNSEAKRHENLVLGRSVSRERLYMEVTRYDEREKHSCALTSSDGEKKKGSVCERGLKVSSLSSPPLQNVKNQRPATCKSKGAREHRERFIAGTSVESSIFYYDNPPSHISTNVVTNGAYSPCLPIENFLKVCAFCKCHLGVGKDIYMYRGDQAFCSAECRYQQIMIDECLGLATC